MHLFDWFVMTGLANGKQSTRFYLSSLRGTIIGRSVYISDYGSEDARVMY